MTVMMLVYKLARVTRTEIDISVSKFLGFETFA